MPQPGDCFKVETSYGDDRPSWWVYRRVRRSIADFTECHVFETRSDGVQLVSVTSIRTAMLRQQTRIEAAEWVREWERWQVSATEPWHVD
jgi:hypothetical protein